MNLFGKRHPDPRPRLDHLERELSKLSSELRTLQTEQTLLHDQVRKWMRRAVAAERHVEAAANTEGAAAPPPARTWGARGRRFARAMAAANGKETHDGADS